MYCKPYGCGDAGAVNAPSVPTVGGWTNRAIGMTSLGLTRRNPGHTLHLVQRGRGRAACFSCEQDRITYLGWLAEYARASGCAVHAYVLMGNHVHLLLTPSRSDGVAFLVRQLDQRYAGFVAERYGHAAPLWDERIEIRPVYPRRYVLGCMRYIELNPVRAGLTLLPAEYQWSSFGANALGIADPIVTPHAFYCALGRSMAERQAAYRALFQGGVLRQSVASYRLDLDTQMGAESLGTRVSLTRLRL